MEISFRPATESDLDLLLELMRELNEFDETPFDASLARAATIGLLKDRSFGLVHLICCDHMAVGYVVVTFGYSLEFGGRDAFVDELYVRPAYRDQGIGTKTLEFADEVCRSAGVQALHLEVERKNVKAEAFYRKAGFQEHDRYLMTRWVTAAGATV